MSNFTTINLAGDRVLVRGVDTYGTNGETVLDGSEWAEVQRHEAKKEAAEAFDAAVDEFYAPLVEAAEALNEGLQPTEDPNAYVVFHEGVEGVEEKPAIRVKLSKDAQILRLLASDHTDRLIWVDGDLEILQYVSDDQAEAVVADVLGGVDIDHA